MAGLAGQPIAGLAGQPIAGLAGQPVAGLAGRWAIGFAALGACAGWLSGGYEAALAVTVGAGVMGLAVAALARGLAVMLQVAEPGQSIGRQAAAGFVIRHGVVGLALWASIDAGLSPGWLVVGVTAWPLALMAEGLRRVGAPASAPDSI